MREPERHGDEVAGAGVEGRASGGVETDFAFLDGDGREWGGWQGGGGETNSHVEALVVHFVEVEDGAVAVGRDFAFDYAEAVLG